MITEVAPVDGVLEGSTVRNIWSAKHQAWECDSKQASVLESEAMDWRTSVHGVASVRLNWARRAADLQKATSDGSEEQEIMVMGRCSQCRQPRQAGNGVVMGVVRRGCLTHLRAPPTLAEVDLEAEQGITPSDAACSIAAHWRPTPAFAIAITCINGRLHCSAADLLRPVCCMRPGGGDRDDREDCI